MNWTIHSTNSQPYVKVICESFFTIEDFFKMEEELLGQPFWRPGINVLLDYRGASFCEVTLNDLRFLEKKHVEDNERVGDG